MATDELIEQVKEAATAVYSALRAGYEERVYEEAMAVEFRERDLTYEIERNTEIYYRDQKVGTHRLDFILNDALVVELKAVASISNSHKSQTAAYLRTLGLERGMVVNFPYPEKDAPGFEEVTVS
ncbi:MAG: GxxExxY protein [Chloroflexi bacterium]|nr:GxxExxY protein [Chloroflexota bacterium]